MTVQNSTAELLDAIKKAQAVPANDPILAALGKSTFTQATSATTGLTFYDLQPTVLNLYPVLTPLRNAIPRVSGKGGIQANWKAVTAINTSGMRVGVSIGNRGGVLAVATKDYNAAYKGIGIEDNVDFEAQYAGQGFDDIRARAAKIGLESCMLGEEAMILGGNTSIALGQTPTPTLSASTTGGSLAAQTLSVIAVALSFDATINASLANGVQGQITRTNADGSSDTFGGGAAARSANSTVATTGATGSVLGSINPVSGALGYAWYWGAAGSEVLGAITTLPSVSIVATATGTQLAGSLGVADNSTNSLSFDGLLTQALKAGSGAFVTTMPAGTAGIGTPLTADGSGGIVEVDAILKQMWDVYRLSPDTVWVNSQEALNLSKKILAGSANSAYRVNLNIGADRMLGGGFMIRTYLNRFSMQGGQELEIKVHPNMPAGTILFTTNALPYPVNGVGNVMQIRTRQDYYQIEWPLRSRKYEYGVYADEVLQHFAPFSMAVITNIGNG